jgi:hypothetical protein
MHDVLYYNDPSKVPLTDFERASDLPYDTDIGEGDMADVASTPDEAFRLNVLSTTRTEAVKQVRQMVNLIEDISKTMVKNSVQGEETRITTSNGVEMVISK